MGAVWVDTDHDSRRVTRRFAYLPTSTFDAGWIWLRWFHCHEHIYGWGFHDKHNFVADTRPA